MREAFILAPLMLGTILSQIVLVGDFCFNLSPSAMRKGTKADGHVDPRPKSTNVIYARGKR